MSEGEDGFDELDAPGGFLQVKNVNRNRLTVNYQAVATKAARSLISHAKMDGFEHVETKHGVLIEARSDTKSGLKRIRGTIQISAPPQDVYEILNDVTRLPEWDSKVTNAEILARVSETHGLSIVRIQFKGGFMVDPRDLSLLRSSNQDENGYVVASCSVDHPNCQPRHGVIRATATDYSYLITPTDSGCAVIGVYLVDMKTGLLSDLFVPTDFPAGLAELKKLAEK
eukprot:c41338_g1_i1.p1 GENE.c41338_g1_i1~~c41338_g1_i1.p1  ORF type:complete len:236 (+),score=55.30 c41338_g1_i1:30-710(+)